MMISCSISVLSSIVFNVNMVFATLLTKGVSKNISSPILISDDDSSNSYGKSFFSWFGAAMNL